MFGINLNVIVAMVTKLCTYSISAMAMHAMLLRFASCIPMLILKSQRHNFSQTNNFSKIIKFGVKSKIHSYNISYNLDNQQVFKELGCLPLFKKTLITPLFNNDFTTCATIQW